MLLMTGGAAVKLTPITGLPFETVDTLIFEGSAADAVAAAGALGVLPHGAPPGGLASDRGASARP
jgi:hypothetical protein